MPDNQIFTIVGGYGQNLQKNFKSRQPGWKMVSSKESHRNRKQNTSLSPTGRDKTRSFYSEVNIDQNSNYETQEQKTFNHRTQGYQKQDEDYLSVENEVQESYLENDYKIGNHLDSPGKKSRDQDSPHRQGFNYRIGRNSGSNTGSKEKIPLRKEIYDMVGYFSGKNSRTFNKKAHLFKIGEKLTKDLVLDKVGVLISKNDDKNSENFIELVKEKSV